MPKPTLRAALAAAVCALATLPAQRAYGVPTADPANGARPRIDVPDGPLLQGQPFSLTFRGTRPNAQAAWLVVSTAPSEPLTIGGVQLHVATSGGASTMLLPLQLLAQPSGDAALQLTVALPAFRYFVQLLVDTGNGLAASAGQELPLLAAGPTGNPHNQQAAIGTNLAGVNDWSTERPFLDAFKCSREWISGDASTWSNGWPLQLDANGNVTSLLPNQVARTVLLSDCAAGNPGGRWLCLHDGNGTIQYGGSGTYVGSLSTPGRHVVDVTPTGYVVMTIAAIDPANPLRNLRFVPEAAEATHATAIFTPEFLARTRGFSTLRFMDWAQTNDSPLATWANRPRADEVRWSTPRGVPVEIMVELANRLDADAWFCIPHLADDAYVTAFATYVRDHLEPGRKAWVEHSNEVWNGQFAQAQYAQQRGLALNLSSNAWEAQLRYHSQRSVQIFQLFTSVFGGNSRLVRVLASQAVNVWGSTTIADHQNAWQSADALAIAPYFGPGVPPSALAQFAAMTVSQVLDYAEFTELPAALTSMQAQAQFAASRNLTLVAYEGGQHLVGIGSAASNQTLTGLLIAANRHPRMAHIYQQYLAGWRAAGGRTFAHFSDITSPSQWGSWGALEYVFQDVTTAPKYLALQSFLLTNPRWW
jgi:hypothetical protein